MKVKLTAADRALYGGPEWLDADTNRFTVSEAEAFQETIRDESGNPIPVGAPYVKWLATAGVQGIKWAMWLGLRRADVTVGWTAFDPDILGAEWQFPVAAKGEVPSEGKAPGRSTRQRRSGTSESSSPQP